MKKMIAALLTLALVFAVAMTAQAEEPATWKFMNGIEFNMDMDQVMELAALPNPEIENHKMRGPTEFYELEYDKVTDAIGLTAEFKFFFVGNGLVAIHADCIDGTDYSSVRETLAGTFGEAVPFDAAKIGNARFVIDDDGDLKDCKEMIEADGLTIVLEQDHEGDVDVTFLDMTAAYINA